jgi:hypothetical protein
MVASIVSYALRVVGPGIMLRLRLTCGSRSSRPVLRPQIVLDFWSSDYVFVLKSTRAWHLHSNAGSASGNLEGTSVEHINLYERRNYSTTTRSQWKRGSSSPRNTVQWTIRNPKSSDHRAISKCQRIDPTPALDGTCDACCESLFLREQ